MAYPPMLTKSNMSMLTAISLSSSSEEDYWNSSVHCSYYSVLQMMLHVLTEVKNPPLNLDELIKGGNSHKNIADAVATEIHSKTERISFYTGFEFLKNRRVCADYKTELFKQSECLDIRDKAEKLRKKIISYFRNGN